MSARPMENGGPLPVRHWPTVIDPGLRCECGWTIAGVRFAEAKRRWWQHVRLEAAVTVARTGNEPGSRGDS